jgi:formylglycine-generating enzyme required for sulfatase activity
MASISGGMFQMGQPNPDLGGTGWSSNEQPVDTVTVSAFYMDTTEVTQADYLALMHVNPSYFTGDSLRSVETMSWFDAVLYCNKRSKRDGLDTSYSYTSVTGTPGNGCTALGGLVIDVTKNGYRLPTEAEWEYACRAGSTTDFYWGKSYPPTTSADSLAIDSNALWYNNSTTGTQPVAMKKPNAWGLYDMSGNVCEWCNDWYGSYSSGSQTDPTGPSTGSYRVVRGGSWNDYDDILRSARRDYYHPDSKSNISGFRCVRR